MQRAVAQTERYSTEMRMLLLVALIGCASQQQLANTPTATTRRPSPVAPPASVDDKDRYRAGQQLEDQRDAEEAYREAAKSESAPPKPKPAKRGPAVQAPDAKAPATYPPAPAPYPELR